MENHPWQSRSAAGFTLIELLVVVAIIAILVGVLTPASCPRQSAIPLVDLSNLRQISLAMWEYEEDHSGWLPAHPEALKAYFPNDGGFEQVFLSPYHDTDAIVTRDAPDGLAIRYGGYVFINNGIERETIREPDRFILAYTAVVSEEQTHRSVLFADGQVEKWPDQQLRDALPPEIDVDTMDGPDAE